MRIQLRMSRAIFVSRVDRFHAAAMMPASAAKTRRDDSHSARIRQPFPIPDERLEVPSRPVQKQNYWQLFSGFMVRNVGVNMPGIEGQPEQVSKHIAHCRAN